MSRRVFITCDQGDVDKADDFCRFIVDKDPVWKVTDRSHSHAGYIKKVGLGSESAYAEILGTSLTVVLIGGQTKDSSLVVKEISESLCKKKPNGILGIRLQ